MSIMLVISLAVMPLYAQDAAQGGKAGGVTSLEKRIQKLEEAIDREPESDKWYDRIQISGLVEVEANSVNTDFKDPATKDTSESDVDLAKVELVVDAKIHKHVDGHVMFKWEADTVFVDEGFVTFVGTDTFPAYLIAGRQYIPFGNFESHFVTDPLTLDLGETNEGAAVAGYRFGNNKYDISVGAFNGKATKAGSDSTVDNFVASFAGAPLEWLSFGASYTSNIAAADGFADALIDVDGDGDNTNDLKSYVGGWSAFVTFSMMNAKLIGEYVSAADEYEAGEVFDATDTKKKQPSAWNVELGYAFTEKWELAGRYEASTDTDGDVSMGDGFPESRYGAVVNYGLFDCNLALEYLKANWQDDAKDEDVITLQFAVEF